VGRLLAEQQLGIADARLLVVRRPVEGEAPEEVEGDRVGGDRMESAARLRQPPGADAREPVVLVVQGPEREPAVDDVAVVAARETQDRPVGASSPLAPSVLADSTC
jgi:hypothetical protein